MCSAPPGRRMSAWRGRRPRLAWGDGAELVAKQRSTVEIPLVPLHFERLRNLRSNLAAHEAKRTVVPPRVRERCDVPAPHEGAIDHDDIEWLSPSCKSYPAAKAELPGDLVARLSSLLDVVEYDDHEVIAEPHLPDKFVLGVGEPALHHPVIGRLDL